jgi:predicted ArsR family transcriptional regulator
MLRQHAATVLLRHHEQQHSDAHAALVAAIVQQAEEAVQREQVTVVLTGPYRDWFQEYGDMPGGGHDTQGGSLWDTERV